MVKLSRFIAHEEANSLRDYLAKELNCKVLLYNEDIEFSVAEVKDNN